MNVLHQQSKAPSFGGVRGGQVDYLIVGQGLCGTFLSWYLDQYNKTYIIIDEDKPFTASKVSSGIINPITGRRFVKTWMIDELLPFANKAYTEISETLNKFASCHPERSRGINCIEQKNVIHFFSNKESQNIFYNRLQEDPQYLRSSHTSPLGELVEANYGYGEINPCYLVNTRSILNNYRKKLIDENRLLNEQFNIDALQIHSNSITYKDITAEKIIFCDGASGAKNPFFKNLPYALNKGQFLLIKAEGLPNNYILKKSTLTIVPWEKDIYWIGTSYEWNFDNTEPTKIFREKAIAQLKEFLKISFEIIDHQAAIRSATLERRPFVGLHPNLPNIGILNGMGTKGCSLAPYFSHQLAEHLCFGKEIMSEANVNRFKKVLDRK